MQTPTSESAAFLAREYRLLWESYGTQAPEMPAPVEPAAEPRPVPEGESPFLVAIEMPAEPVVGFVVKLPIEFLRLRKEEEALWERMLQALSLDRSQVALIKVAALPAQPQNEALSHFLWSLPASLKWLVFFGPAAYSAATGGQTALGQWEPGLDSPDCHWICTHDLAALTRDPNSKKETWNHLKDHLQRLK